MEATAMQKRNKISKYNNGSSATKKDGLYIWFLLLAKESFTSVNFNNNHSYLLSYSL